ncbi:MAG: hypothetical protein EOP83_12990 [Verrucomicrobiaceae bacterium]|nr:MAG: hypothetical protein EOP83_12990 [Verrucomicrobiaceae bacterium]
MVDGYTFLAGLPFALLFFGIVVMFLSNWLITGHWAVIPLRVGQWTPDIRRHVMVFVGCIGFMLLGAAMMLFGRFR